MDDKDRLIWLLAQRIFICSGLLGAAAERLRWDSARVQELLWQLEQVTKEQVNASIES